MKLQSYVLAGLFCAISLLSGYSLAQEVTVIAPSSEAAEGLDLEAVGELFKQAKDLEAFEQSLNDPESGINNLDLDDNGEVDFIRVVEEVAGEAHVIILQVPLAENEFQDVATIEVEKDGDSDYNMQVHGNEIVYGVDYYVAPVHVHVHTWPIIGWIFHPHYHPYRSAFYFGFHPYEKTTIKAGRKEVTNPKPGKETVVRGVQKTKTTEEGKKTLTVKVKKTTHEKSKNKA